MTRKYVKGDQPSGGETTWTNTGATRYGRGQHKTVSFGNDKLRPSPNHGTQRLPNDDYDIMLSSANRRILDRMFSLMSMMYSKKSIGPRTEPCGTPDVTSVVSDRAPLTETRCLRFDRKYVIQLCALPVIPYEVS